MCICQGALKSVHASSCQVESSPMTATLSSSVECILLRLGVEGRHSLGIEGRHGLGVEGRHGLGVEGRHRLGVEGRHL